jgi:hypothetical protein
MVPVLFAALFVIVAAAATIAWKLGRFYVIFIHLYVVVTSVLSAIVFFGREERYTRSGGYSHVGTFQFGMEGFLSVLIVPILHLASFVILGSILSALLLRAPSIASAQPPLPPAMRTSVSHGIRGLDWFLVCSILLLCCLVAPLMFVNGLGITGVEPPALPFKLAGLSHYATRYLFPLSFLYLALSGRIHGRIYMFALPMCGLLLGVTQASKLTLAMYLLAPLFLAFRERRIAWGLYAFFVFLLGYQSANLARNFMYAYEGGKNLFSGLDFVDVLRGIVVELDWLDLLNSVPDALERLGGSQDVVLASQAWPDGDWWGVFRSLYLVLLDDGSAAGRIASTLYQFEPPQGTSPGTGTTLARILLFHNMGFFPALAFGVFHICVIALVDVLATKVGDLIDKSLGHLLFGALFASFFVVQIQAVFYSALLVSIGICFFHERISSALRRGSGIV